MRFLIKNPGKVKTRRGFYEKYGRMSYFYVDEFKLKMDMLFTNIGIEKIYMSRREL